MKKLLLLQKWYLWQLPLMTDVNAGERGNGGGSKVAVHRWTQTHICCTQSHLLYTAGHRLTFAVHNHTCCTLLSTLTFAVHCCTHSHLLYTDSHFVMWVKNKATRVSLCLPVMDALSAHLNTMPSENRHMLCTPKHLPFQKWDTLLT